MIDPSKPRVTRNMGAAAAPLATGAAGWPLALASGVATLLIGVAAGLLPLVESLPRSLFLGSLLIAEGVVELVFGTPRRHSPAGRAAATAGLVTAFAGLIFITHPTAGFFPAAPAIAVWLLVRGLCVLVQALPVSSPWIRLWLVTTGGVDLLLGLLLASGLRITSLVAVLFGSTREMVASFALILALSFVVAGIAQIAVGLRREERPTGNSGSPFP